MVPGDEYRDDARQKTTVSDGHEELENDSVSPCRRSDSWARETVPDETREPEQREDLSTPQVSKSKSKGVAGKDVTSVDITTTGDAANDVDGLSADDEPTPAEDFTLQHTDDEIETAQQCSKFVKRLLTAGKHDSGRQVWLGDY
ncbi:hypothetical protein PHMEG_0004594 [Phytophthora megakarya]|uniref:Uncharacterized protein n=1 Tax=Phytophthora megakarya TaxID=4795 RepID=A0A225WV34_9STRA|nr:hypothetical protein PHMEG_0004594 [Phytophthora megakarya]